MLSFYKRLTVISHILRVEASLDKLRVPKDIIKLISSFFRLLPPFIEINKGTCPHKLTIQNYGTILCCEPHISDTTASYNKNGLIKISKM